MPRCLEERALQRSSEFSEDPGVKALRNDAPIQPVNGLGTTAVAGVRLAIQHYRNPRSLPSEFETFYRDVELPVMELP